MGGIYRRAGKGDVIMMGRRHDCKYSKSQIFKIVKQLIYLLFRVGFVAWCLQTEVKGKSQLRHQIFASLEADKGGSCSQKFTKAICCGFSIKLEL